MRRAALALLWLAHSASGATAGELADAGERQQWELLRKLISSGAPLEAPQNDGMTALHWAAFHDSLAATRALLDAGAEPGRTNDYGVTALSLACQNGNAEIVAQLLAHGADPNTKLDGGETALMTAARTGCPDCVKALLAAGAEVDAEERSRQTALMWAAAEGHTDVVDTLLEAGAEFRKPLKSGFTPLLFAVRQGHIDVVRSLLEAGADVNRAAEPERPRGKRMRSGTTPLILAVENGHFELAIDLVGAGADPNDQRSGFTPLHVLTWVRKSVRGDGDDGIPTPRGSGDLGSLGFARALVARGADVNARLKSGSGGAARVHRKGATPFLMAAETCDVPLMKLLLELGADPEIPNVQGCKPILAAAGVGVFAPGEEAGLIDDALEAVAFLLEIGADINSVDDSGETVMHGAAYKCAPQMIELLDRRGAKIEVWNTKNKSGWTPLMIAQGFRPGNFRPIAEVTEAVSDVMLAHGVTPPPPPERSNKKKGY